ncbi:MAG: pilus assembly protein PilM [Candidatus Omnitrophica bacterium]|nr:pilus assembly protein PilM [Candidatus Omnitrophota bacterium]
MMRQKNTIGLSLDAKELKLVQLSRHKESWIVQKAHSIAIKDSGPDGIAAGLAQIFADADIQKADVVCAVSFPGIYLGKVLTPRMPRDELLDAIRWEIKDHLSFPLEEAVVDYRIQGHVSQGDVVKLRVLVAAVSRPLIENIRDGFRRLNDSNKFRKVRLSRIIPAPLAGENVARHLERANAAVMAVLQMGEEVFEVAVYCDGQLEFTRKLPVNGRDITESLTKALVSTRGKVELTSAEAEEIKGKYGISLADSDELLDGKISGKQLFMLVRPKLEKLAHEIRRSIEFFAQKHDHSVECLILFGKESRVKGLERFLAAELKMPIQAGNACEGLTIRPDVRMDPARLRQEFDLALGACWSSPKGINLVPSESLKRKVGGRELLGRVVLSVLLLAALGGLYGFAVVQKAKVTAQWETLHGDYEKLMPLVETLRKKLILNSKYQARKDWQRILMEISQAVPDNIYILELWVKEDVLYFKGVMLDENTNIQSGLTLFLESLEKQVCTDTQLIQMRQRSDDKGQLEFRFSCTVA